MAVAVLSGAAASPHPVSKKERDRESRLRAGEPSMKPCGHVQFSIGLMIEGAKSSWSLESAAVTVPLA